ncbi:MAG: aminoacyltransferase, partial [Clostridiales bacterium]|nr:aminoacyltransferase [Clostridiales bacterium]
MENFSSEFDNFIKNHPKGHFLQSGAWSELKNDWRSEIITVTKRELSPSEGVAANSAENDDLVGGMLVLIRKLPLLPYRLMYSPRGPVCDPSDRETFALLTQKARELAKREHAYALKIDPDIESSDSEFAQIARS